MRQLTVDAPVTAARAIGAQNGADAAQLAGVVDRRSKYKREGDACRIIRPREMTEYLCERMPQVAGRSAGNQFLDCETVDWLPHYDCPGPDLSDWMTEDEDSEPDECRG